MRRLASAVAGLVLVLGMAAGCAGGDATPTDPAGGGVPTQGGPADDPGQRDPGGELEEPGAGEAEPDDQPGIEDPPGDG